MAFALLLTLAIGVLRVFEHNPADAPGVLLIVPVAVCAVRFGIRGGVIAASLGVGLAVALNATSDSQLTWVGYATRAAAVSLVGVLVGWFVDRRRELEGELALHRRGST